MSDRYDAILGAHPGARARRASGSEASILPIPGLGVVIDEYCRAGTGVRAIGDLTGVMPFTHVGKYQARIVCDRGDYDSTSCASSSRTLRSPPWGSQRTGVADTIARPWTHETEPRGEPGAVADRTAGTLVGAWAVAPLAGEWIH